MRAFFRYFFLIRFFRGIRVWPPDWPKLCTIEAMETAYPWQFGRKNLDMLPPDSSVRRDWEFVQRAVFPAWIELDFNARFNGAIYYRYQYFFVFGVVATAVLGIIRVTVIDANIYNAAALLSVLTALIAFGAVIAGSRKEGRVRWTRSNNLADTLDRARFLFVLHVPPYTGARRASHLLNLVDQIRKEYKNLELMPRIWLPETSADEWNDLPDQLFEADAKVIFKAYLQYRRQIAVHYLESRARGFDLNLQATMMIILACLILAALCGTLTLSANRLFSAGIVVFPLIAVLFFMFRLIYDWERTDKFKESLVKLNELLNRHWQPEDYPQAVAQIERIIIQAYRRENALSDVDDVNLESGGIQINPVFGTPLTDRQFKCDVFMIMPFRELLDKTYREIIVPTLGSMGLEVKRGDDFHSRQGIMTDIWAAIYACDLVVAECSEINPNVYYELGIAHTLGKPTIMIAQNLESIPFDLRHLRHIIYQNDEAGLSQLQAKLRQSATILCSRP